MTSYDYQKRQERIDKFIDEERKVAAKEKK
jgi:hypothetical protein